MAQHRQAPSQFKEEPGHDSVSATLFFSHPASPGRKHVGRGNATDRTRLETIPTPFPWQIFHIITHASREFRDPVRRQAHRISTRGVPVAARDRDRLTERQTLSQTPAAGPESPRALVFYFSLDGLQSCSIARKGCRSRRPWIRVFQKTDMPVARMTRCGFGRSGRWELQGGDLFHESPGLASGSMRPGGPACV